MSGNRIQLTTDGFGFYPPVVDALWRNAIDYAQIIKEYSSAAPTRPAATRPRRARRSRSNVIAGDPDASKISTSYVERQNLTMRMGMRRFTRLTNGFTKKVENHAHAVCLHFMHYNFCRPHQTLTQEGRRADHAGDGRRDRDSPLVDHPALRTAANQTDPLPGRRVRGG